MKKVFHTVGPTELYPEVKGFIAEALESNIPSLSHRSADFMEIYKKTTSNIRKLLGVPDSFRVLFLSSATECMERIIQNLVEKNSFHFINGSFSKRFYTIAKELGKHPEKIEMGFGKGFDFDEIKIPDEAELICLTQNETSTGVALDMDDIYRLKEKYPDKLIALDIVTGAPYMKVDFNKIDCAFFSVQKGFGLPGGLGVLMINEMCVTKAKELRDKGINTGSYHSLIKLTENADKFQTTITPNVINIFLLGKVCKALLDRGIENIRKETEEKARTLYDFFEKNEKIKPFVKRDADRSLTTITLEVPENNITEVKEKLLEAGIVVSSGYKEYKNKQIRIGNFPMHTMKNMHNIIESLRDI